MGSYVSRLRKAFAPADFDRLFRIDQQLSLFEQQPLEAIQPRWIRCPPVTRHRRAGKG